MISSKVKVLVLVSVLLLCTSIITVGCKGQAKSVFVNTNSMPGRTFRNNVQRSNSRIVYLGSNSKSSRYNFGPKDISFKLKDLK